jgi:(p)ppGpp synthase/HD superfamily hydrolase
MTAAGGDARLMRAALLAAEVHRTQRGKGAAADVPYVNHVIEVAALLAEAGADQDTVIAGLLHDTIEDGTEAVRLVTREELAATFGATVAALVVACTDDKSLPKDVRKELQVARALHAPAAARMIKLADKISNLRRIAHTPPDWDEARMLDYVAWAERVAAGCYGVNAELETAFDQACAAARTAIRARSP